MSRKKVGNVNGNVVIREDKERNKYGKAVSYILYGLIGEIFLCLICGWFSGNTELNAIQDNFVTSLLQNYNYILGAVLLIPVILYVFSKIKDELKNRFISDDQSMMLGFLGFIVLLIGIISVCSIVYPINATTWYGVNSAVTVGVFLCSVVTLVLVSLIYGGLKIPSMLKNKGELWKAIKKYLPIILLVVFIIWTFISCMLAPEAADNIIGKEAAAEVGAEPDDVLAKTLNGCYNLKDGFWAFLMYGSVMIAAMLIGKEKIKEKKNLIAGFVIVISVLSIITLIMSNVLASKQEKYDLAYKQYYEELSGDYDVKMSKENFEIMAKNEAYEIFGKWYIYPQRAMFRNSNHFAYVLSLAILAAAGLALVEKNILFKMLYLVGFAIMTAMLLVNNTFGGYLGVLIALVCLAIYGIISCFIKNEDENAKSKNKYQDLISIFFVIAIFIGVSFGITNGDGSNRALSNLKKFGSDIGIFGGYMVNTENPTEADVSTLDNSIRKAGSGRGETWIKVWELVKQRPMFGYGLECLLFQFSGQFDVNEGRTHNLLLQLLATVGIPGTIMYFAALAIIFIRLLKNWKTWDDIEKICVFVGIAYMVTALTGNSTYYTSPYFMMFLGFVALTPWKREESVVNNELKK